ncbi:MAG: type IV pilus biogenesis/stability protein PilW [Pseudomonadota bacterium]
MTLFRAAIKPLRAAWVIGLCCWLSACVTETSGGIPGPKPDAERVAAQLDLARGYLEQRDWTRAKAPLRRALAIDASNVEAHVLSGVLFGAEKELDLAEQHYREALRLAPDNAQALNNYASFLYAQGRIADAVVPLKKLVQDTGYRARPQAFESLGIALLGLDDTAGARAAFERALQLNVRLPRANLELAELALQAGEFDRAQSQFDFYNRLARPTSRSLCLGYKLARHNGDSNRMASYELALKNLFADQAEACLAPT